MHDKIFLNKEKFNALMEEIDEKLKNQNIAIHARPLLALREICIKYKISLNIAPLALDPIPNNYLGDSLSAHTKKWYDERYGNRLKNDFSLGTLVLLIKRDPWRIKIPLVYGRFSILCDREISASNTQIFLKDNRHFINPIAFIEGMTPAFSKTLSDEELLYIANEFNAGFSFYNILKLISTMPYIKEASSDILNSINTIFAQPPHYGQSQWSTLQFVEKTIKSFLNIKKIPFQKNHDLIELSALATKCGLPKINTELLKNTQCAAGVRYGEIVVSLEAAVLSLQSAIQIFIIIGNELVKLK